MFDFEVEGERAAEQHGAVASSKVGAGQKSKVRSERKAKKAKKKAKRKKKKKKVKKSKGVRCEGGGA